MNNQLVENAVRAGQDETAPSRAVIVCGSGHEAEFWRGRLGSPEDDGAQGPTLVVERGRKGNFLGCLDAYARGVLGVGAREGTRPPIDQMIMLFGSGTRLSPFTQALANIKSAFPLPRPDRPAGRYTMGEAAMRSNAPIVDALHGGGLDGLVIRWGDELYVPSGNLESGPGRYADFDVIRFGWRTDPTDALAGQKEWLITDGSGAVVRDIPRQPLASLRREIEGTDVVDPGVFVNLGNFAASHWFLETLADVFADELESGTEPVNWDPSFWVAVQCDDEDAWTRLCRTEADAGRPGLLAVAEAVPTFYERVRAVRERVRAQHGRDVRVGVLDFGEPYWLDAGSHTRLAEAMTALFSPELEGEALRALLDLPDSLASGGSVVKDSSVVAPARVTNSVVLGARIDDASSSLERAVVLGGRYGRLVVTPGGVVISSVADDLTVEGPHGVAFRLRGDASVRDGEAASTVVAEGREVRLTYAAELGVIDDETFSQPVLDNEISYADASRMVRSVHPLELDATWTGWERG